MTYHQTSYDSVRISKEERKGMERKKNKAVERGSGERLARTAESARVALTGFDASNSTVA
jgi:hypothetical protein